MAASAPRSVVEMEMGRVSLCIHQTCAEHWRSSYAQTTRKVGALQLTVHSRLPRCLVALRGLSSGCMRLYRAWMLVGDGSLERVCDSCGGRRRVRWAWRRWWTSTKPRALPSQTRPVVHCTASAIGRWAYGAPRRQPDDGDAVWPGHAGVGVGIQVQVQVQVQVCFSPSRPPPQWLRARPSEIWPARRMMLPPAPAARPCSPTCSSPTVPHSTCCRWARCSEFHAASTRRRRHLVHIRHFRSQTRTSHAG
ncbi:hypothetical protein BDV96DRAFT_225584 [Lophiotrema nucula]|uniref:Uncharacterized protein n=1 Tax=Lophiotrema nucula TaxID=690887 RepID=A0A6A5YS86_9PLEO|nr:hypothetical protein BDV96DRAFT_225584 [Lophiotrema nucula]